MKWTSLLVIVQLGGAVATLAPRVAAPDVLNDLKRLSVDVSAQRTRINNYDGSIGGLAPIQQGHNTILSDIRVTTGDATNSSSFSSSDSQTIANYLSSSTAPDLSGLCSAYRQFKPSASPSFGKNNASSLASEAAKMFNAIYDKVTAAYRSQVQSAADKVRNACNPTTINPPPDVR